MAFEFFEAVDGQELKDEQLQGVYFAAGSFKDLGRYLHKNEIACYLSHVMILRKMVEEQIQEALIIEDDIILFEDFTSVLECRSKWLPEDWRLVNFAYDIAPPRVIRSLGESRDLSRYSLCTFDRIVGRGSAYLISLSGAERLLEVALPIVRPWDDIMGSAEKVGAPILGVVPRIAQWNDDFGSSIWVNESMDSFARTCRSGFRGVWMRLRGRLQRKR